MKSVYNNEQEDIKNMAIIAAKFDLIEYTKQLCSVGVTQEQANVQAQAIEKAIEAAVAITKEEFKPADLCTKKDLDHGLKSLSSDVDLKIALLRAELVKWILGTVISVGVVSIGAMFTILKFMLP
jgi:hypothetical protein